MRRVILGILLTLGCTAALAQVNEQGIAAVTKGKQAEVGVAVIFRDKAYTVGDAGKYPLMSVFKIHVAAAALNRMENEKIQLDRNVTVKPKFVRKDVYSPLVDKYHGKKINTTYREILKYSLAYDDVTATDWLIGFVGGIDGVNEYVKSLGVSNFSLTKTDYEVQSDVNECYGNWGTPLSVARLLRKVFEGGLLFEEHVEFLREMMGGPAIDPDKLRAGLPSDVGLAHLAGESERTAKRVKAGACDAGVMFLPNGEKCYIAVLVKDARETDDVIDKMIADVAATVFRQIYVLR